MKIPLKYNIRSLFVRWFGTVMTALGIGLTVAIVVVMLAMIKGLDMTFMETGDEQTLVVIRKGSQNETNSYYGRGLLEQIRFLDGVERDADNEPLAVGELVVVINHERNDGSESNIVIRGTSDMGYVLRPDVRVVEGRKPRDGLRELIVGESISKRFKGLGMNESIEINNNEWKVVGLFTSDGGVYDSEIWGGYQDIAQVWQRPIYSSALLRADSLESAAQLADRISEDQRIQLDAISQKEYYEGQTISSIGLKALATFVTILLGIGSCFAIMNMMYAMVMSRIQEVATLRALGFRRRSILGSFVFESAVLSVMGGILGCAFGSIFNGYSAGTSNFSSFSEIVFNFRITPDVIFWGILFSLVVGVIGGFLPAQRAASVRLIDVLRQ